MDLIKNTLQEGAECSNNSKKLMIKGNMVLEISNNLTKITQLKSHRIFICVVFYVIHSLNACHV